MTKNEQIQCVILAGGKGSRLDGKGKYSQQLLNKTLLDHVFIRMSVQTNKIAVNFHDKNLDVNKEYVLVYDKFKSHIGPLAGIHAAISHCIESSQKNSHLVVTVPVDTPFLPLDLIARFKNKIESSMADVIVACSGDRYHPTVAMWRISVMKKLEYCIQNNIRKIDLFTKELDKSYVNWNVERYDPFYNINNHNDLKIAETMIKNNIIN
jgi:molybdopterin-guanine dinucleotide biosynthesis protein A